MQNVTYINSGLSALLCWICY